MILGVFIQPPEGGLHRRLSAAGRPPIARSTAEPDCPCGSALSPQAGPRAPQSGRDGARKCLTRDQAQIAFRKRVGYHRKCLCGAFAGDLARFFWAVYIYLAGRAFASHREAVVGKCGQGVGNASVSRSGCPALSMPCPHGPRSGCPQPDGPPALTWPWRRLHTKNWVR